MKVFKINKKKIFYSSAFPFVYLNAQIKNTRAFLDLIELLNMVNEYSIDNINNEGFHTQT